METHEKVEGFRREQVRAGETRRVRQASGRMVMSYSAACNGGNCDPSIERELVLVYIRIDSKRTTCNLLFAMALPRSVKVASTLCLAFPE